MVIAGLQKFSLSDFPGVISAIVFTQGCGFRCPYCHNPELVDPSRFAPEIPLNEVRNFLRSRMGQLQGVVVTGGEPTIHTDLPDFLSELKGMSFAVKLDTNGTNPRMLQRLVDDGVVDYIAMDIKAPLALYPEIAGAPFESADLLQSIALIRHSGLPHEFRTTFVESILSVEDLFETARLVKGCQKYAIQRFRGGRVLEAGLDAEEMTSGARLSEIARILTANGYKVEVR